MQRSAVRPSPVFFGILALTVVGGLLATFGEPRTDDTMTVAGVFILVVGGWALSLTLHEFGHAFVAYKGGDYEVVSKGYLNMDVRRYTDPVLSLLLPLLFLVIGGIPLPGGAVWINRWALRNRAFASWTSLAGPLTNLLFGIVLAVAVQLVPMPITLLVGLSFLALLQIATFVLNILPVPGLDGYGAIEPYLSPDAREFGAKARPWAPLILFALLFAVPAVGAAFWEVVYWLYGVCGGNAYTARLGGQTFQFWR